MIRSPRAILFLWVCLVAGIGAPGTKAEFTRSETVLSIPYGTGADQIDTTLCEYSAYWKNLIANYRVAADGSLWLLTAGGRPALRHFVPGPQKARQLDRIDLPIVPGGYDDFLVDGSGIVLSQSLMDMKDQAAFFRVVGDSVVEKVVLSRKTGYNHLRGWGVANLGRLRKTGTDWYNAFPRTSTCIRIGDGRLSPRLEATDLLPGIPILSGELLWADRLIVMRGITPVLDLGTGLPGQLEEVFDDGGFVIRRIGTDPKLRGLDERFELYAPDGVLRRAVVTRAPDPHRFTVSEGEVDFFTPDAVYQLEFDRFEFRLVRY